MFAKDNSSLFGTGTKKGKEVALRKSDRRHLRDKMYETLLLLPDVPSPPLGINDKDGNSIIDDNSSSNTDKSVLHRVIDEICLQGGTIVQRPIVYAPDYKKVTIYIKSPSLLSTMTTTTSTEAAATDHGQDSSSFFAHGWPFTRHPQAIWLELDISLSERLQVPTVALLSVLHAAAVAATTVALLLPTIAVPPAVSKNLCRGAHLMRAGIFAMPNPPVPLQAPATATASAAARTLLQSSPPKQQRLVALAVQSSQDNDDDNDDDDTKNRLPQQPFAVGLLHPAIQSLHDVGPGTKGVGVDIITCYGDDFWRLQQQQPAQPASISSRATKGSGSVVVVSSPTGGAPFDAGHYGNVGFVKGEYVVPIVAERRRLETKKEEQEENGSVATTAAAAPTTANVVVAVVVEPNGGGRDNDDNDDDDAINASDNGRDDDDAFKQQGDEDDDAVAAGVIDEDETTTTTRNAKEDDNDTNVLPPMTPDEILHQAVCRALVALHPAKRFLPMPMSIFYANHVLKHKPADGVTRIELKKTKYKKFGAYIQEQVSRKLIEAGPGTSSSSGGTSNSNNKSDPLAMLIGYDRRHDDLKSLVQQAKETAAAMGTDDDENNASNNKRRKLVLVDLYRIPPHFVTLLRLDIDAVNAAYATSVERRNTGYLTGKEVREILEQYIGRENLVDTINKGCVHLDGPLTDALFPTNKKQSKSHNISDHASSPAAASPPVTLSRKDLVAKWQSKMQDAYALVQMPGNLIVQMQRGRPPQVTITVTKRQNRKFITRVRGVEYYGVNALQFKNDVSQRLACAGSVEESPKEKLPHKDHVELVFQGNIHQELQALLLGDNALSSHGGLGDSDYQLPKNSIQVILRKDVPGHKK